MKTDRQADREEMDPQSAVSQIHFQEDTNHNHSDGISIFSSITGERKHMKTVIIGGVAAGAGAAARLRRLDEQREIILIERGKSISYANCGLPYHLGGVIPDRERLLVIQPEKFAARFRVDVRTEHEVLEIDRKQKLLKIRSSDGTEYTESYDKLLLATGSVPVDDGTFSGKENPRVLHLWTLADMDRVMERLKEGAKRAIIVGAGFVGLETAENLKARGLEVTILQRGNHVLPTLDPEMASSLTEELLHAGIQIRFGCKVRRYQDLGNSVRVELENPEGESLEADLVIVSTGVRPNSDLAKKAGLACGERGHVSVDEHLRTSDPDIYAAGDVVEITDSLSGEKTAVPLAGPANRQGRIAADNLAGITDSVYRRSLGTSTLKAGRLTAASVGITETRLKAMGRPFRKIYLHPSSNASYYPGAARLDIKLIFEEDGSILGAQIVGMKGADKRIDAIAQAMRNGLKAPQLGELELAYAPPYNSAKDPVNFAGFIAENVLTGRSDVVYPDSIPGDALILDVREPEENALGTLPGAINIPLEQLRDRLGELDAARLTVTFCQVGLRGYLAERILKQHGFRAANLSGGWITWKMFHPEKSLPSQISLPSQPQSSPALRGKSGVAPEPHEGEKEGVTEGSSVSRTEVLTLDVRSLPCPGPVVKLKAAMNGSAPGTAVHVLASPSFEGDLIQWAKSGNFELRNLLRKEEWMEADVLKPLAGDSSSGNGSGAPYGNPVGEGSSGVSCRMPGRKAPAQSAAIVLFSNDYDKAMAAMILANAFAAAGMKVGVFFTFWGLSVLKKNPEPPLRKTLMGKLFGFMLPCGAEKLALSKMNMMGFGTQMMKDLMKQKKVMSLPELIRSARESGVRFIACEMAMDVMGISREELIEVDEVAGAATFAALAGENGPTLFI